MTKLLLGLTLLVSFSTFSAEFLPVVEHQNSNYGTESLNYQCKKLGGSKIISTAFSREAIAGICQIGEKTGDETSIVVAVSRQIQNNPQGHGNITLEITCEVLGGKLKSSVNGPDKISGGVCEISL